MQEPQSNSTLDLVANESQNPQNLSRVDLRPDATKNDGGEQKDQPKSFFGFYLDPIKEFPSKLNKTFQTKIDEAKSNSSTKTELFVQISRWFSCTLIWTICFAFTVAIPVILGMIGLFNLNNCDAKPSLPYLVFATGFVMTCSNLFNLAMSLNLPVLSNQKLLSSELKNVIACLANIFFNCIVAFLYIVTATAVFALYKVNLETDLTKCGPAFYSFVFYFIVVSLSITAIISVIATIAFAYNRYKKAIERGSTPISQPEP